MSSATGPRSVPTIVRQADATPDGVLRMASMGHQRSPSRPPDYHVEEPPAGPTKKLSGVTQLTLSRSVGCIFVWLCLRLRVGGVRAMEGAMLKAILCNRSASRVEIDQRARDAHLRLEQIERLLVSRAAVTVSRVLCLFGFARPGEGWRASRTPGPLNNRRPRVPQIHTGWVPSAP